MFDKADEKPAQVIDDAKRVQTNIAVVGFSGRFPGGANSPDELWETLRSGRDAVGEVKGDRWDLGWHNPDADRSGRVYTRACGLLDQIDGFDADFFGISPREAQQLDPQQRLLLELAWEAFDDAGIPPRGVAGENIGVFVGISSNDYAQMAGAGWPDAYSNTGIAFSIAANRISYVFDLHGPSFAVDTACSSSLVCVHQAVQAIERGECSAALAGGVSVLSDIRPWLGFSRASMLSPDGRCKSFDESGNGYVRSEGGGLVLLKPLADAERDGDNILCVIRATGINSDGRTLGIAMPNGDAQADLLDELYTGAGIAPEDVFYVEAHGTGTSVGDPIECGALGRVLGSPREDGSVCHIGSVKSNIGHLEPASGIAGMTKVILSLKNREIPANLHYNTPNPKIEFDNWKLKVVDEAIPLPDRENPIIIGINSFGFGGTNSHVIIEEYRRPDVAAGSAKTPDHLILSASSEDALREMAQQYLQLLREPDADYGAIAGAAALCRSPLRMRLALKADCAEAAVAKLEAWLAETPQPGTASGSAESATVPTAFVFSGNGPQWWGMGRELLAENPIFRSKIEEVDAIFVPLSGWSLIDEMAKPEEDERIGLTEVAQPMLFAMQMGVTAVLEDAGIRADAVFGHSVGEVAAACASGALTLEQATKVIFNRSALQARTAGVGKMAALGLAPEDAQKAIAKIGGWLEIAAVNGPNAVTVAGDDGALNKLVDHVTEEGQFARVLKLDYPFHTQAMEPIKSDLMEAFVDLVPSETRIPFISTVTGAPLEGEKLGAEYWYDNVRQPVQFHDAVMTLLNEQGVGLFIEVGPHPVLKDYVNQTSRAAGVISVTMETLRRPGKAGPESDVDNIANAIANAYAHGASALEELYTRPQTLPKLPIYPWQRTRHWRGAVALPDAFTPTRRDHPLLGVRLPGVDAQWEMPVDKNILAYLEDHVIQDSVLFPAAGYLELILAAAGQKYGHDGIIDVETLQIMRPLVLTDQSDPIVQTVVDDRDGTVEISSRRDREAQENQVHVRGRLSSGEACEAPVLDVAAMNERMPVIVGAQDHYAGASKRGLDYGPTFQGVQQVRLTPEGANRREALATVRLDFLKEGGLDDYRAHPSLFDSCIQAVITLIGQQDTRNVSTIPVSFDKIRSFAPLTAELLCHVDIKRESLRSVVADVTVMGLDGRVLLSLNGARCQKANLTGEAPSPLTSEWWRPDTKQVFAGSLPTVPTPQSLVARPCQTVDLRATLDEIATLFSIEALDALRPPQTSFTMGSFAKHARIGRAQGALLTRLLDVAQAAGKIEKEGKAWTWTDKVLSGAKDVWAETFRNNPAHQAELLLLAENGVALPARLKGEETPEPNAALTEQLHDTAPIANDVNQLAVATMRAFLDAWPADRPIRILEVGGGTGGLTSWILPMMPSERVDYLFTDPADTLVGRAERRFAGHRFVRTAMLQPDIDPVEAGLPGGYFDLVLVTNMSKLGANVLPVISGLKTVMAEGCKLVVFAPQKGAAADLLYGDQPEIDAAVVQKAGFRDVSKLENGAAHLFVGTQTSTPQLAEPELRDETFLIVAERVDGFAEIVADVLAKHGQRARVIGFPTEDGEAATHALQEVLNSEAADRVVLLGSKHADASALLEVQSKRALTAVALVGAMELVRQDHESRLAIVTRGAFPSLNGAGPIDPAEAALWGLGRVIGNEYSGLEPRLIDLHAADEGLGQANALVAELLRSDDETEVQLSNGHRFVNRERIMTPADEARSAGLKAENFALDFVAQGGIDSLHLRELTRREPAENEVEIAVKAAGLNFRDVLWCMGMLPEEAVEHGFSGPTIGMECAGEVLRVGANVTHLAPGDRVMAFASSCFGTHVTTQAKSVAKMPDSMDFSQAATVPTTFLTAWYGLDYLARLEEGETILIHGAAGGVGFAAIQIAKLKGARIIGTAGSPMKRRMLEMLGVDHVLNSRTLEFADEVMALTGGHGVDVILNSLAGEAILKNLNCLRPFGRFLEIGKRDLYENSRIGLRPFRNNLSYFGIDADTLLIERAPLAQRLFNEVISKFGDGELKALPHQVVPVSRASEAFRAMQQSRHVGKLVVSMEQDRPEDLHVVRAKSQVRSGGTYLVTGGLGGFGLSTARWLVEQGADALALVSRSGATRDEAKAAIAEFEAAGIHVRAFAADVSDPVQVGEMVHSIRADMPPLIGIIHSAAVIEDAPILNIEAEQLDRVFKAKLVGAWNLHQATLEDALEMFVLYSSSSAVVGNPGQGAYVAANLYLDALALHRRALGLPGLAVGWGAILDAGFLTRHENVRDMLKTRTGLDATPAHEALADLGRISAAGASRVSVARFDLQRLHQMLPAARVPRFLPIVPNDATAMLQADETLADLLENMPKSEQREFILERIIESTARVMGTSASQINPSQPLGDLGLDSLMAVELAGSIERDVGQSVPVMQLLGADSLTAVADFVGKLVGIDGDEPSDAPAAEAETPAKESVA